MLYPAALSAIIWFYSDYNILTKTRNFKMAVSSNKKKKFNLYNLFNGGEGKGIKKEPEGPKNLKNFFKSFSIHFRDLVKVNLFMVLGNFPIIFVIIAMTGLFNLDTVQPQHQLFSNLYGMMQFDVSPVSAALFGVFGVQKYATVATTATYICMSLGALIIFTFGYVNVGTTYILRNIVKGEPIFFWHDFWYAIKRNKVQGMILGILDVLFLGLIVYDVWTYALNTGISLFNIFFWITIAISLFYIIMRFYMYILMVTFDLSIFKILKNSLIFMILGIRRNLMALLGIVIVGFMTFMICYYLPTLGILIPFLLLFGACSYMSCYAAYPKIKEIMIDPYYDEDEEDEDMPEPVFRDMG